MCFVLPPVVSGILCNYERFICHKQNIIIKIQYETDMTLFISMHEEHTGQNLFSDTDAEFFFFFFDYAVRLVGSQFPD